MPEIKPDLNDTTRCISVHWSLPVQCVLPSSHRENDHEAWHPETGNRMRYRRTLGVYATEELHHGEWHDLRIPPPGAEQDEADRQILRAASSNSDDWDDATWAAWFRIAERIHGVGGNKVDRLRGELAKAHEEIDRLRAENADYEKALGLNEEAAA